MALAVINENIDVPRAILENIEHIKIGDGEYTALGTYRQDNINIKRVWRIRARYITKNQYDNIYNHFVTTKMGKTRFWLDEFGGTASGQSIDADISITEDTRTPFFDSGSWQTEGRTIVLEVREK